MTSAGTRLSSFKQSLWAMPLFSTFFLWSFGTGAQQLARPLFAFSFGVPIFLVTLIEASNAGARLVSAPITGFLTDRWGRKPLFVVGNILRGITLLLEFFAASYWQFLLLEFIGGIGVSVWVTSSSVVMADLTDRENRGRAVALRGMSMRAGMIAGPVLGGVIVAVSDLRYVFLFNAVTKILIMVITLFLIRETRPEVTRNRDSRGGARAVKLDYTLFLRRAFIVLALITFSVSMMGAGVFQALFPLHAKETAGLSIASIGQLISIGGFVALLISYPNGMVVDRYGRKKTLVPGLLLLGAAAFILALSQDYMGLLLVVIVYGLAQGMSMGATQTYAMDLAPEDARGTFLGVWSLFQNLGGLTAPLLVGFVAGRYGFNSAFTIVAISMGISALLLALFGPETGGRKVRLAADQAAGSSSASPGGGS